MSLNQVSIVNQLSDADWSFAEGYSQVAVIVDENTLEHCYPIVKPYLPKHLLIEIISGEEQKHLGTCQHIWDELTHAAFDRKGLVINLGGGVIGDMGGFCAATYKRGIDFVQIPTTLLSQVDASVGGKLGIDFQGFKNHIGVFRIPKLVLICPIFLKTLLPRELRSGFAEVIKHGLIRDKQAWEELSQKGLAAQDWASVIQHSVALKAGVVEEDPEEKGLRKILNFGHTVGHAVETHFLSQGPRLLHGEAIAIGMIAEAYLSHKRGWVSLKELKHIEQYLLSIYGKVELDATQFEAIAALALQDKKNVGGQVRAALLEEVGRAGFDHLLTSKDIVEALEYYKGLEAVVPEIPS